MEILYSEPLDRQEGIWIIRLTAEDIHMNIDAKALHDTLHQMRVTGKFDWRK